jgi:hypothetical protein
MDGQAMKITAMTTVPVAGMVVLEVAGAWMMAAAMAAVDDVTGVMIMMMTTTVTMSTATMPVAMMTWHLSRLQHHHLQLTQVPEAGT